jgi:hypothetical protein
MKLFRALRRLLANSDRLNDIASDIPKGFAALYEALDHLARDTNRQSVSANEKLTLLHEALNNQSRDLNLRLDKLTMASAEQVQRARQLIESITNQSSAVNLRFDRVIANLRDRRNATPSGDARPPTFDQDQNLIKGGRAIQRAMPSWLNAPSPSPLALPIWSTKTLGHGASVERTPASVNALKQYQPLLEALRPWEGMVPKGYLVDFLGILTDAHFRSMFGIDPATAGGNYERTEVPGLAGRNGEMWFEAINWFEAARAARNQFVMFTLGACYGAQAVGAYRALQIVNPMPCKLVAVEPEPENYLWVRKHFRDNGINPDDHWLVNTAISDVNAPIFFPVGGAGSGANNCMSTDLPNERRAVVEELIAQGNASDALRNLMLHNTTGVIKDLIRGSEAVSEIELVSAITLRDLLAPFEIVDYVEADIQQSEVRVFPPFLGLLKEKVRRIHIGTHGAENHDMLHNLFENAGWEIVFSYGPNRVCESDIGKFELNDGVLTVRNPDL